MRMIFIKRSFFWLFLQFLCGTIYAFCTVWMTMAMANILLANKNREIFNTKHQHQQQQQQLDENFKMKMQQNLERQERAQHIFDPFDFTNLRQLQKEQQQQQQRSQISVQNSYNNDNDYSDNNEESEKQQQQQLHQHQHQHQKHLLHLRPYKDNRSNNDNNNNNNNNINNNINNNNEGNEYKSAYPYYLFDNNNNNNNKNTNDDYEDNKSYNNANAATDNDDNNNDDNDDDDDNEKNGYYVVVDEYSNGNRNNGDWATLSPLTHQDANNDFRLQLSNRNEPVNNNNKNKSKSANNNKNKKKSNKKNTSMTIYTVNTGNHGHRNNRINANNAYSSIAAHNDIYNSKKNSNKSENNGPNVRYTNDNSDATDTTNGHTIKIRGSQSYGAYENPDSDFIYPINEYYWNMEDEELNMQLPYGIQNVRKRGAHKNNEQEQHSKGTTYQSLCPTKRETIPLETVGFEYRPNHYIEVTCVHNYLPTESDNSKNKICSEAGFSCIQLNRTIHLIRRNKLTTKNCWESEIRIVPSGCECMWPMHSQGDIAAYHNTKKRYNPEANIDAVADYTPGLGYQQMPRKIETINLDDDSTRRQEENNYNYKDIDYEKYFIN